MSQAESETQQRVPVVSSRLKLIGDGTEGVLLGRKCKDCGEYYFGAPRFCLKCTSAQLESVELSRAGTLDTYTIVHQAPPGWPGPVPYILGVVRLPEGPRVTAEIVDCPQEAVKVGMPLELTLRVGGKDKDGNEIVVYKWHTRS